MKRAILRGVFSSILVSVPTWLITVWLLAQIDAKFGSHILFNGSALTDIGWMLSLVFASFISVAFGIFFIKTGGNEVG